MTKYIIESNKNFNKWVEIKIKLYNILNSDMYIIYY
jgi:hypothetical protein